MHLTGFSTSPPTVVLKGGKPHALTSGRSADKLHNLSCVHISKWEYTFQITYVFRWRQCFFTETGGVVNMVEQSFARKDKFGSQCQNLLCYLLRDFNLEDLCIGRGHME